MLLVSMRVDAYFFFSFLLFCVFFFLFWLTLKKKKSCCLQLNASKAYEKQQSYRNLFWLLGYVIVKHLCSSTSGFISFREPMEGPKNHLTNQHRSSTASCKTKLLASLSTAFILEPETDSKISPPFKRELWQLNLESKYKDREHAIKSKA